MVMVSWHRAAAYANWRSAMQSKPLCYDLSTWECNFGVAGYRPPTESEWKKAARAGAAGHRFPCSDTHTIQRARANYYSSSSYSYDTRPTPGYHPALSNEPLPYTSPVGCFAANGDGLCDMAVNVSDRCRDRYSSTYYSNSP